MSDAVESDTVNIINFLQKHFINSKMVPVRRCRCALSPSCIACFHVIDGECAFHVGDFFELGLQDG